MELIDIIIIIIALAALVRGFSKGLITQIGALAGIIIAILASRLLGPAVCERWAPADSGTLGLTVCYTLIFTVTYFGVRMAARLIRGAVHTIHLAAVDRFLGAAFSLFEWLTAISLAMNLYAALMPAGRELFTANTLRTAVFELAPALTGYICHLNLLN